MQKLDWCFCTVVVNTCTPKERAEALAPGFADAAFAGTLVRLAVLLAVQLFGSNMCRLAL